MAPASVTAGGGGGGDGGGEGGDGQQEDTTGWTWFYVSGDGEVILPIKGP